MKKGCNYGKRDNNYLILLHSFSLIFDTHELYTLKKSSYPCADLEVRHSNTEESVFHFIRRKYNLFGTSCACHIVVLCYIVVFYSYFSTPVIPILGLFTRPIKDGFYVCARFIARGSIKYII